VSESKSAKAVDTIQEQLAQYASTLDYADLTPEAVHAAKVRLIDTFGANVAGFLTEPSRIGRALAAQTPSPNGATVIGTYSKTTPDMAAFVNGTAARYVEMTDIYRWPGSYEGHPSDVVAPVLAIAEHVRASGRELILATILAYEVYLRISDRFHNKGFDHTIFCTVASAAAAARLLRLSSEQIAHAISMAVVPNNVLRQLRYDDLTMWIAVASGHAGRAGVFAAQLAQAGMEGPHLPFEGKAGWCDHVARERFTLGAMGGRGAGFKVHDSIIKQRPGTSTTLSSILAGEKVAGAIAGIKDIERVTVEVYQRAKIRGADEHAWNPPNRETANHSIPYVLAATLLDGTVTPRSFNDARLWDPDLRELMQRIEVVENDEFTRLNERVPVEHHTRVTVVTARGERLVGEAGGAKGDMMTPKGDAEIIAKFRNLTDDCLGSKRAESALERLWRLEEMKSAAEIPPLLAFC